MAQVTARLILSLGEKQEPIFWCWGDMRAKQWRESGQLTPGDPLASLPEATLHGGIIVLVPTRNVVLRTVSFYGPARFAKAEILAFQCEEELLEEVDQLHWVILGHEKEQYALAGYRHEDMQYWLSELARLGVQATVLLPDLFAQPFSGVKTLMAWRQQWLLRTGIWSGYSVPQAWLTEDLITVTGELHKQKEMPFSYFLWGIAQENLAKKCTLLQGVYAIKPSWKDLSLLGYGASILGVVLLLSALGINGLYHCQQSNALEKQALAIYQHYFPTDNLPTDLLAAIRQKIRRLQENQDEAKFFDLSQQLQQALTPFSEVTVKTLTFDAKQAEISMMLATSQIASFNTENEQGNTVSWQPEPEHQQGVLSIRINR